MPFRLIVGVLVSLVIASSAAADRRGPTNGFVLDEPLVPARAIKHGGPGRGGIPAIDSPSFVRAGAADFLEPDDRILGVRIDGIAKAYPVRILNRHEIVNDEFDGRAVIITYCPLCGSGITFDGHVGDRELDFGVSGLLYNSDVLLYDRDTESLWSQIMLTAVNGPLKGTRLEQIPMRHTSWQDWQRRHPDTLVLSTNTGYGSIDYNHDPYAGYEKSRKVWFPLTNRDSRLESKEWVLGVLAGGTAKAYPFGELQRMESPIIDRIAEQTVRIDYDPENRSAMAYTGDGQVLQTIQLFWFAWAAFHPDTAVFTAPRDN